MTEHQWSGLRATNLDERELAWLRSRPTNLTDALAQLREARDLRDKMITTLSDTALALAYPLAELKHLPEHAQGVYRQLELYREQGAALATLHYPAGAYCVVCDEPPQYGEGVNNPACEHNYRHCHACTREAWPCKTAKLVGFEDAHDPMPPVDEAAEENNPQAQLLPEATPMCGDQSEQLSRYDEGWAFPVGSTKPDTGDGVEIERAVLCGGKLDAGRMCIRVLGNDLFCDEHGLRTLPGTDPAAQLDEKAAAEAAWDDRAVDLVNAECDAELAHAHAAEMAVVVAEAERVAAQADERTEAADRDHRLTLEMLFSAMGIARTGSHPRDRERLRLAILELRTDAARRRVSELDPETPTE